MSEPVFLSHQRILRLSGSDRKTFLQGLMTNDIQLLSSTSAVYSLMLTPQGKFLYDFFLYEYKDYLFIDIHQDQVDSFKKRLNLYKLRADVSIEDISVDYAVFSSLNLIDPQKNYPHCMIYQDPRLKDLGYRWIVKRQSIEVNFCLIPKDEAYDFFCMTLGIPKGYKDMIPDRSIPLESGVQDLNAISWTKGCYIGQELMARTRYRGEIRKRLFPVELTVGNFKTLAPIVSETGDKVGDLYSFQKNQGIARLKIDVIQKPLFLEGALLKVHQPNWMNLVIETS